MTQEFNLKVLAYTFDNGFLERETLSQIKDITAKLNVDWIFSYEKSEIFKRYIQRFLLSSLRYKVQLCTFCGTIKPIFFQDMLQLTRKYKIPLFISGVGVEELAIMDNREFKKHREMSIVFRNHISKTLKSPASFDIPESLLFNPEYLPFWRFSTRNIEKIQAAISSELGWRSSVNSLPGNSTNCLLSLLDQYLCVKYKIFSQYENEFSLKIRLGEIERQKALAHLNQKPNKELLKSVARQCNVLLEAL